MPNHSAVAIANEFLRRRNSSAWPPQLVIQKLVNAAHGWNMAINEEPLVEEEPQAWDNGPVFRSVWDHIKENGYRGPNCELVDPHTGEEVVAALLPSETAIIDHVWAKYGSMSAPKLSDMTHEPGTPWYKAYYGRGRNAVLDRGEIVEHYRELAKAGRAERSH